MAACVLSIDVGRKNLALCALEPGDCARGSRDVVRHWCVTACDPTPAGIRACLAKLPWAVAGCGDVVIERQPNRNAAMTRLQHYLEMYFVMRDKPVTVQDAKHKLAFAASTAWWPEEMAVNWTYHTRKKLAVATTQAFLGATPQAEAMRALFAQSRKKDDLADSCLQGMAFCHNVRPLEVSRRQMALGAAIKPRRPTAAQAKSGKYSKPNIVHFLKACRTLDDVARETAGNDALARSVARQFGGADAPDLVKALGLLVPADPADPPAGAAADELTGA